MTEKTKKALLTLAKSVGVALLALLQLLLILLWLSKLSAN